MPPVVAPSRPPRGRRPPLRRPASLMLILMMMMMLILMLPLSVPLPTAVGYLHLRVDGPARPVRPASHPPRARAMPRTPAAGVSPVLRMLILMLILILVSVGRSAADPVGPGAMPTPPRGPVDVIRGRPVRPTHDPAQHLRGVRKDPPLLVPSAIPFGPRSGPQRIDLLRGIPDAFVGHTFRRHRPLVNVHRSEEGQGGGGRGPIFSLQQACFFQTLRDTPGPSGILWAPLGSSGTLGEHSGCTLGHS